MFDVFLNIVATAIPIAVLQLCIYPLIATNVDDEIYGLFLTQISVLTIISGSLGNALNNIRLVKNEQYEQVGYNGDFQILLFLECIVTIITLYVMLAKYNISFPEKISLLIIGILWTIREYYIVVFRLKLNFKGIVINNILMVVGYLLGLVLFLRSGHWEYIYILGLMLSLIYIYHISGIIKEPFKLTNYFKGTFVELILLVVAAFTNNMLNYADRTFIYPLIGGVAVSIYYAATLFGKLVSTAISPINSVVLSYLSKKHSMQKKLFVAAFGVSSGIAVIGYFVCNMVAKPMLSLLYPQLVEESMKYVPVTTLIAMITMVTSTIAPFILKFCHMKWQVIINVTVLFIYIVAAVMGCQKYGLMGFCYGVLISCITKCIITFALGMYMANSRGEN